MTAKDWILQRSNLSREQLYDKYGDFVRDTNSKMDFEELTHRRSRADRKRIERNCNKFGKWMIDTFKRTAPRPLNEGEKYHCQGMRMNPENNLYLRDHVDGRTWVDYSPVGDDTLGLNEVEITHWFDERRTR